MFPEDDCIKDADVPVVVAVKVVVILPLVGNTPLTDLTEAVIASPLIIIPGPCCRFTKLAVPANCDVDDPVQA
jgi:hypothetical protein